MLAFPSSLASRMQSDRTAECARKTALLRSALSSSQASAVRLRGADWFAWATAGADSAVLLTTDIGVAEILVTEEGSWVLTDTIEAARLIEEELPHGSEVFVSGWESPARRESFVVECAGQGRIL